MMKGMVSPLMVGIAAVLIFAGVFIYASGMLFPAAEVVPAPACMPGEIIKPLYGSYQCLPEGISTIKRTIYDYVGCGLYWCADITCNYIDLPEGEGCTIKSTLPMIVGATTTYELTIPNKQTRTIAFVPVLGVSLSAQVWYRGLFLQYTNYYGIVNNLKGGCDLAKAVIGEDVYSKIPEADRNRHLVQYETVNTIVGYDGFAYVGNYVEFDGQHRTCQSDGLTRSLYTLKQVNSLSGCYWYPDSFYKNVECCPDETRIDGATCSAQLTWVEPGPQTGCCSGGFCSDIKCPGEGSWYWAGWTIGDTLKRYECNVISGSCDVKEQKTIECNPFTNLGCPANMRCSAATLTCEETPQPTYTCLEAKFECCLAGMFPFVSDIRTCADAGKPDYVCVQGYCYAPRPVDDCNFNGICEPHFGESKVNCPEDCYCDLFCTIGKFLGLLFAGLIVSGAMLVLIIILGIFIPVMAPVKAFIMASPKRAVIIWIAVALVLTLMFTPLIANLSYTMGVLI